MQSIELVTRDDFIPVVEQLKQLAQMFEHLTRKNRWKVYTNEEAAKLLKVSKRTLQNWRNEGLIDFTQLGSKIYYTEEGINELLSKHKKQAFAKKAK